MLKFLRNFLLKKNKLHEVYTLINKDNIIFDIGAHIGGKSEKLTKFYSNLILVEPQPNCVKILQKKFKLNKNVKIVEKGVGNKKGFLDLNINSQNPLISTFSEDWKVGRFKNYKWDKSIKVEITTIDDLIEKYGHPGFIKIDVEGFEYKVLQGLSKKTGIISYEFTSEFIETTINCLNYLNDLGYEKFNYSEGERKKFSSEWSSQKDMIGIIKNNCLKNQLFWGDIYAR